MQAVREAWPGWGRLGGFGLVGVGKGLVSLAGLGPRKLEVG